MSHWVDIKPKGHESKEWIFGYFRETPSERGDEHYYSELLFRNSERTIFGIKKYENDLVHWSKIRVLAAKIIADHDFRKSLVSNDPELPKRWKKH